MRNEDRPDKGTAAQHRLQANLGTLHYADYKANTPAWQNRNKLDKHGKPLYKIGDDVWRKI